MKTTLLLLFVVLVTTTFGQTQFNIHLPNKSAEQCKEFLSELDKNISDSYHRTISNERIVFNSITNYDLTYVEQLLNELGVSDAVVSKSKEERFTVEKAGGVDCELAEQLCSSSSVPANSSGFGIQELPNNNTIDGCLTLEHQSSWYYINIQTGGSLSLRINPVLAADDYDFAIWGPFTAANVGVNCPPVTNPIRCSYSSTPGNTGIRVGEPDNSENSFGDRWVNALTVLSNEIYIVLIDNFSISGTGYSLDFNWGGNTTTAVIGCTPVVLPVEISSFNGEFKHGSNVLSWTTESETNNDYFEVEWTNSPESNWTTIDKVDGAGDHVGQLNYALAHKDYKKNALNYYRIKQVDFDGASRVYPQMIVVDNRLENMRVMKVVNLLGQEVSDQEKGLVIYMYEDGSCEKIMRL